MAFLKWRGWALSEVDLREQVARRLHDLYMADAAAGFTKWDESPPSERAVWIHRVASEVIRIAEWARRNCREEYHSDGENPPIAADWFWPDLTLPPNDWQP